MDEPEYRFDVKEYEMCSERTVNGQYFMPKATAAFGDTSQDTIGIASTLRVTVPH